MAAIAGLGALAAVGLSVASCEGSNTERRKKKVRFQARDGDTTPMEKTEAEPAVELVQDALEAENIGEVLESRYRDKQTPLRLVAGPSHPELAAAVAKELFEVLVDSKVDTFADGEIGVKIRESVRGADVYVIQPTSPPANKTVMELLLMISTLRRASAKRITAVVPYYGYKRDVGKPETQTHLYPNESLHEVDDNEPTAKYVPISAADIALMLETMGVDRVITVDLQPPGHGQIEGFFNTGVSVDSLRSVSLGVRHFASQSLRKVVVVAPNEACVELARDVQTGLMKHSNKGRAAAGLKDVGLAVLVQGGRSRGMDRYAKRSGSVELVGDVQGADVILVDDMIDTGNSLKSRVSLLKESGARRVFGFATHGLFSGPCLKNIAECGIESFAVTDTVPLSPEVRNHPKIVELSVAPLLAQAIKRMHRRQSLQHLRVYSRDSVDQRYAGQGDE